MAYRGALERAVLAVLWDAGQPLVVREIQDRLSVERRLAYTTVQTVADRLARKGLLVRSPKGRAFCYAPAQRREDHLAAIMLEALDGTPDRDLVLTRFAKNMNAADARRLLVALLDTLVTEGE